MTTLNPAQSPNVTLERNPQLNTQDFAGAASTRIGELVALAQNPSVSPVARGQALAELDAITGSRAETMQLLDSGTSQVAQAATETSTLALNASTFGGDLWSRRIDGIQDQLAQESRLQAAGDPGYSNDLATFSNRVANGTADLPEGTYTRVNVPDNITTTRTNPLAIEPISARNSQLTIQGLDADIAANNAEIARLTQRNDQLRERLDGNFNPIDQARFRAEIRLNGANILQMQGENTLSAIDRNKAINDARLQADRFENGNVYRAQADNADASRPPVIFINGVNTDINRSALQAMELSEQFRAPVDHVVNVSSMDSLVSGAGQVLTERASQGRFGPNISDLRIQQHLTGNPPAAVSAANAILDQLDNSTGKVKIVGYSQGAAIGTEALRMVDSILEGRGLNRGERAEVLNRIEFLGIGPAAAQRHITTSYVGEEAGGPALQDNPTLGAVDYRTLSDVNDPIAKLLNVSTATGEDTGSVSFSNMQDALTQMTRPEGILPHLSYFRTYEATDPGSIYNPEVSQVLHQWYAGSISEQNTLVRGTNTGQ